MQTVSTEVSKYIGSATKLADIWGKLIFNVKDPLFAGGAKGDWNGTTGTDPTAAFQAAINACILAGGGVVKLPPGIYYFPSTSPNIDPGIGGYTIEGSGRDNTIILFDEGTSTASIGSRKNLFFNNTNDPNKKGITIRGITFRGTKSPTHYANGGVPLFLDYYSCIKIYRCAFENLSYMAMDTHYNKQFIATNNRIINISADGFRARDTSNVLITNNYIKSTGDDAIAVHIANPTITTFLPTREAIIITDNILEDCFPIKALGGREVTISNNILRRSKITGIQVINGGAATEGNVPIFNVKIHDNQIIDLINVDGTAPLYAILVSQSGNPARGGTATSNIAPTRANATNVFVYPWNWRNIDVGDAANAIPPLTDISIQGNTVSRTLPAVAAYSDWGFGSPVGLSGATINPAITDAIQRVGAGVSIAGSLHNVHVSNNTLSSVGIGVYIQLLGLNSADGLKISNNIMQDVTQRGVHIDSASDRTVIGDISNNVLLGDIYRKSSNSNANGTYAASLLPEAVVLTNIRGVSVNHNQMSHWCNTFNFTYQNDNQYFDNLAYGFIAAIGFSTSNIGIGTVNLSYNIRHIHSDMTPSSATYLTVLNATPVESTAMPTTGTHVQGAFVRNSNAVTVLGAAASKYIVLGWTRITTGSGNVLNTDWVENRALTGT